MIILNHKDIPSDKLYIISNTEDIKKTPPNSIVLFNYDISILKYCFSNNIEYSVNINSIKEAIFANNLGAKYIISKKELAIQLQPVVQNYLFDSKNIAKINDINEIEQLALKEVDGVIL